MKFQHVIPLLLTASLTGCGDSGPDASALGDGGAGAWVAIAGGSCNARERRYAELASPHVEPDAGAIAWLSNPPSSGPHYGQWARWGARANIARGYWVHNLEHGGVVFVHRCTSGTCDGVQSQLVAATQGFPNDSACRPTETEPARIRVIVTNDAEIEAPVMGAAWGWVYAADCVDPASMRSFFTAHVGRAPEDFCFEGSI
ncbi:MAG: DUF3105 domain-containing protein [Myxococcales bacterium]|nr:DUF3105 domain-containing protein [Myxococcales bacterium]